jgi:hypothetical protein
MSFSGEKKVQKHLTMEIFSRFFQKKLLQKSHVFENAKNDFMRAFRLVYLDGPATPSVLL